MVSSKRPVCSPTLAAYTDIISRIRDNIHAPFALPSHRKRCTAPLGNSTIRLPSSPHEIVFTAAVNAHNHAPRSVVSVLINLTRSQALCSCTTSRFFSSFAVRFPSSSA